MLGVCKNNNEKQILPSMAQALSREQVCAPLWPKRNCTHLHMGNLECKDAKQVEHNLSTLAACLSDKIEAPRVRTCECVRT